MFVIQEYDPLTFPVGTLGAIARQAYTYPHFAVFSTEFLREYFRDHGLGVFAAGREAGDRASTSFQNAITAVDPPSEAEMRKQASSLLFYARPEPHAERNMFELGVMALAEAIDDGCFPGSWRFYGIGALRARLGGDHGPNFDGAPPAPEPECLPQPVARAFDRPLAAWIPPIPSLVPLEMASAGMPVVTSTFENKTAESLRAISENLIPVEPTVEGIRRGLGEAVDATRRRRAADRRSAGQLEPQLAGVARRRG